MTRCVSCEAYSLTLDRFAICKVCRDKATEYAAGPTLGDLQAGRISPEAFLASRNAYGLTPTATKELNKP